jgi:hypothetical protein
MTWFDFGSFWPLLVASSCFPGNVCGAHLQALFCLLVVSVLLACVAVLLQRGCSCVVIIVMSEHHIIIVVTDS